MADDIDWERVAIAAEEKAAELENRIRSLQAARTTTARTLAALREQLRREADTAADRSSLSYFAGLERALVLLDTVP
jgi:hypothetical protein